MEPSGSTESIEEQPQVAVSSTRAFRCHLVNRALSPPELVELRNRSYCRWLNAASGEVTLLDRSMDDYTAMVELARILGVPQMLLQMVQRFGAQARTYMVTAAPPAMPGNFSLYSPLKARHCLWCDDLIAHPSTVRGVPCEGCARHACPNCVGTLEGSDGPVRCVSCLLELVHQDVERLPTERMRVVERIAQEFDNGEPFYRMPDDDSDYLRFPYQAPTPLLDDHPG